MSKCIAGVGLAAVLTASLLGPAIAQTVTPALPPMPPLVQNAASLAETARAEAIIARDPANLSDVGMLCKSMGEIYARGLSYKTPAASKAFDNLYYVGLGGVGAWAINTSDGIIILDALDNAAEAEKYIEGGLRSLGLDPNRIKYVLVSHGHFDHFGGAKYLQDKFHARILMSPADWALMAATPKVMGGMPIPRAPAHDMDIRDGQKLTLGDTTITFYVTPGHTEGTVSAIFPVKDRGRTRMLSFWGGTLFSKDAVLLSEYDASVRRFAPIAKAARVEGVISNHPVFDNSVSRIAEIAARPDAANPFVIGRLGVSRYYDVLSHCLKAQIERQKPSS